MKEILLPAATLAAWVAGAVALVWGWDRIVGFLWITLGWHPGIAVVLGLAGIGVSLFLLFVLVTYLHDLLTD